MPKAFKHFRYALAWERYSLGGIPTLANFIPILVHRWTCSKFSEARVLVLVCKQVFQQNKSYFSPCGRTASLLECPDRSIVDIFEEEALFYDMKSFLREMVSSLAI